MKRLASYWLEKFLRFNRDPGGTGAFLDLVEDDDEGFLNRWNLREISSYGRMHFIPVELVLRTAAFEEQLGQPVFLMPPEI